MFQIIGHQVKKCNPGFCIKLPDVVKAGWIHRVDDASQLCIEITPQFQQFFPCSVLVVLDSDPVYVVLSIVGEGELFNQLKPDKALVVVGGRINQMANDFLH